MINKKFKLDEHSIIIPKGTDVVLKSPQRAEDGYMLKPGTVGRVAGFFYNTYELTLPTGRKVTCQRDQLVVQKQNVLEQISRSHYDWIELKEKIIYESTVGSHAWGLNDETSDIDKKGIFILPFPALATIYTVPDEIKDPETDSQYWEVQKAIYQALRADANTLETLWSPLVTKKTGLGEEFIKQKYMFVSKNIYGSFCRYAMSQFKKIQQKLGAYKLQELVIEIIKENSLLTLDELSQLICDRGFITGKGALNKGKELIIDLYHSLYDRGIIEERGFDVLKNYILNSPGELIHPRRYRPKNAYNLIRLLYSGINWMKEGEPLIEVKGDIKEELLLIKKGEVPIEDTIKKAYDLAGKFEKAYEVTKLPDEPDYEKADKFLRLSRETMACEYINSNA
jgi:hypothetical protein